MCVWLCVVEHYINGKMLFLFFYINMSGYRALELFWCVRVCECVRERKRESARAGACLLAHFNDTVEEVMASHTWDMLWRSVYQYILCCILPALLW
jgi:hypothetical protein